MYKRQPLGDVWDIGIVAQWPSAATAVRAAGLGLQPEPSFEAIIRQYIADCAAHPSSAEALKGMDS